MRENLHVTNAELALVLVAAIAAGSANAELGHICKLPSSSEHSTLNLLAGCLCLPGSMNIHVGICPVNHSEQTGRIGTVMRRAARGAECTCKLLQNTRQCMPVLQSRAGGGRSPSCREGSLPHFEASTHQAALQAKTCCQLHRHESQQPHGCWPSTSRSLQAPDTPLRSTCACMHNEISALSHQFGSQSMHR